jgi:hypothetical protein
VSDGWDWGSKLASNLDVDVNKVANLLVCIKDTSSTRVTAKRPVGKLDVELYVVRPDFPRLLVGSNGSFGGENESLYLELTDSAHDSRE